MLLHRFVVVWRVERDRKGLILKDQRPIWEPDIVFLTTVRSLVLDCYTVQDRERNIFFKETNKKGKKPTSYNGLVFKIWWQLNILEQILIVYTQGVWFMTFDNNYKQVTDKKETLQINIFILAETTTIVKMFRFLYFVPCNNHF